MENAEPINLFKEWMEDARRAGVADPTAMSLATVTALGYAGVLSGPALIGFVAHVSGLPLALALVAGLLLWVSAAARIVRPRQEASDD